MTRTSMPFDLPRVLGKLKPFQRRTVDYVFHRLYEAEDSSRRFLVADEVGLGKTLVAKGVIAKAIDHLWDTVHRIDIVYICANAELARQNITRLDFTGTDRFAQAPRLTLLPLHLPAQESRLNFVGFTPGTSFEKKSSTGVYRERVLLFHMLREMLDCRERDLQKLLQCGVERLETFQAHCERMRPEYGHASRPTIAHFHRCVWEEASLVARIKDLAAQCKGLRQGGLQGELRTACDAMVGELLALLARCCLDALEPDLVIMDEFQRFRQLLDPESEAGQLAHPLFEYSDAHSKVRTLMLSATPYKMYTLHGEEDDHYEDFMRTAAFLLHHPDREAALRQSLKQYRDGLFALGNGTAGTFLTARDTVQDVLRTVMCRTERPLCNGHDAMFQDSAAQATMRLDAEEVRHYLVQQRISDALNTGSILEFWKSAPYALEFMDDYQLKNALRYQINTDNPGLATALKEANSCLFPANDLKQYRQITPHHAKQRRLQEDVLDSNLWKLLWIPPSLPYHALEGPFASAGHATKRLLFSAWRVAPKAIAAMTSYGAEQRLLPQAHPELQDYARRSSLPQLLQFTRSEERLTGMPVLALVYPSFSLARRGSLPGLLGGKGLPSLAEALVAVEARLRPALERLQQDLAGESVQEDEAWYWAAPILLDMQEDASATGAWLERPDLASAWTGGSGQDEDRLAGFGAHLERAKSLLRPEGLRLGRPPRNLGRVTALLALAGPANCALRSLACFRDDQLDMANATLRDQAAQLGWDFRNFFNKPEARACVHLVKYSDPYWLCLLEYAAAGCLSAVLDEYVHVLDEFLGVSERSPDEALKSIVKTLHDALTLITSRIQLEHIRPEGNAFSLQHLSIRGHFAMRYGEQQQDAVDGSQMALRSGQVRQCFNSPFWPFVLATTSAGQEGLDFHCYCHAVTHWNLPRSPVDMEQREGRVHRYKGHAVRKNVAAQWGATALAGANGGSIWRRLFAVASEDALDADGMAPFWIAAGKHRVERHVYALPLSRETALHHALCKALAVYRMVFGQPRQEDLVEHLLQRQENLPAIASDEELGINLRPLDVGQS